MNIWNNIVLHNRSSPSLRPFKPLCLSSTSSLLTRSLRLAPNKFNNQPSTTPSPKPSAILDPTPSPRSESEPKPGPNRQRILELQSERVSKSSPPFPPINKLQSGIRLSKNRNNGPSMSTNPMVWIDCEMTGLNPDKDKIIQIVCFVTNWDLSLLDEDGFECVISRPTRLLDDMDEWCTKTHTKTGLVSRVKASQITSDVAAQMLLEYIKKFVPEKNIGLLCGNTVHADKMFMRDEFKEVLDHLHYRIGDVSSIKEFALRWSRADIYQNVPRKEYTHEARQDILESIEEARYWANVIFRDSNMSLIPLEYKVPLKRFSDDKAQQEKNSEKYEDTTEAGLKVY